jgi:hypothetical protein
MYVDRKFLAIGNLLFIFGFTMLTGFRSTIRFFGIGGEDWRNQWVKRWRGLISFIGGIGLTLAGYTITGYAFFFLLVVLSFPLNFMKNIDLMIGRIIE